MLYLIALTVFFIIPGIVIFAYLKKRNALDVKSLSLATVLFALIIPADIYLVHRGVWTFGAEHTIGIWFLGMPFEEYLFYFTAIPTIMMLLQLVHHLRMRKAGKH